jgi:hypothetical protein
MPAMKEPTEPKAETQSEQLTCSLTPSSTEPSTWLVIIWLKRWPASPLIELPLDAAPVGVGVGLADGDGDGVGVGAVVGVGEGLGDGEGLGEQKSLSAHCAAAGRICRTRTSSDTAAIKAVLMARLCEVALAMVSARTGCRRHRPAG